MLASKWLSCFCFILPKNMNDKKQPLMTHIFYVFEIFFLARRNQDTVEQVGKSKKSGQIRKCKEIKE